MTNFSVTTDPEIIWKIFLVHGERPTTIPMRSLLRQLTFPLITDDGSILWKKLPDLGRMRLRDLGQKEFEIHSDRGAIRVPDELRAWEVNSDKSGEAKEVLQEMISSTAVLISELDVEDEHLILSASTDDGTSECPEDRMVRHSLSSLSWIIPFKGAISLAISASAPRKTANARHPLVGHYFTSRFSEQLSEIEEFAKTFIDLISDEAHEANETGFQIKPTRWHKRAAYLYFAVPWERYDDLVKPPYYVWTPFGMKAVDENILRSWRDADVPRLD